MKKQIKILALILTVLMTASFAFACGKPYSGTNNGAKVKVKVSFDLNYAGAPAAPGDKTVTVGGTYGALESPSRGGHDFDGWYTTAISVNGVKVDADTVVERMDNHTLFARWTVAEYKIYFNPEGGAIDITDMSGLSEDGTGVYKRRGYGQNYGFLPQPEKPGSFFLGWFTEASGGGLDYKVTSDTEIIAQNHTLHARWNDGKVLFWDFSNDDDYSYFEGGVPAKNIGGKNWLEIPKLNGRAKMLIPVSVGDTVKFTVVFEKPGALKRGYNLVFMKNVGDMWDNHIDIVDINSFFVTPNAAYGPNAYDVTLTIWDKGGAWGTEEFYLVFGNESSDGAPDWNSYYVRLTDIEVVYYGDIELGDKTSWDFSTDGDYNYFVGGVPAKNIGGKNWLEISKLNDRAKMLVPVSVGDTIKFTVVFEKPGALKRGYNLVFMKNVGNMWDNHIDIVDINPAFVTPNAAYGPNAYNVTLTIWDQGGAWGTEEFYLVFANESSDGASAGWNSYYVRLTDIEIVGPITNPVKTSWDFSDDDDYNYFTGDGVPAKNIGGKNWLEIPGLNDRAKMLVPVSVGDTIKFTVVFEKPGALKRGYNLLFMKNVGNMWDNHIDIVDINPSFVTPNAAYGPNAYDVTLTIWDQGGAWGTGEFYLVFGNESSDGASAGWNSYYVRLTDIQIIWAA